jgi:hypothetical protein
MLGIIFPLSNGMKQPGSGFGWCWHAKLFFVGATLTGHRQLKVG